MNKTQKEKDAKELTSAEWTLKYQMGADDKQRGEYEKLAQKQRQKRNQESASGKTKLDTKHNKY